MTSKVYSTAVIGLECELIEVECDSGSGQFCFSVVGLPDAAVQESRDRVRAAVKNSGFAFPRGRVTVNLAPADIKKEGPSYDLPIALSIVMSSINGIQRDQIMHSLCLGELSLDGRVRPVSGVLPAVILAKQKGYSHVFVPKENAAEAALVDGIIIYPVATFTELMMHVQGISSIVPYDAPPVSFDEEQSPFAIDISMVKGQEHAKRALQIAAAGGHNMIMTGPPGSGKTLLARVLASLLPPLTFDEALEITRIYSVAGLLPHEMPLLRKRPFRNPHHTASSVALVGGGSWPRPGEMSLAHRGILFLDEFPEFPRSVLEALRQPLEDGFITVSRSSATVQFPARCMLIAAQNPCPCGYTGDPSRACTCSPVQVLSYQKKISGPLLDRFDLFIDVPKVSYDELIAPRSSNSSSDVRAAVARARDEQLKRKVVTGVFTNAELPSNTLEHMISLDTESAELLSRAVNRMNLSARAYFRVLKVARTIADLEGSVRVAAPHVAESLQYRQQ